MKRDIDDVVAQPAQQRAVKLRIRLTEGKTLRTGIPDDAPMLPEDEPMRRALGRLSPGLRAALIQIEPAIMSWLRESHEHRTEFLLDPVAAIRKAAPRLDDAVLQEIVSLRKASARHVSDVPGLKLDSLVLEVADNDDEVKK